VDQLRVKGRIRFDPGSESQNFLHGQEL
jgi:hypothetical protein